MKLFLGKIFLVCCALFVLGMPQRASAGPLESTVWIEVTRDPGKMFFGTPLPRNGLGMGVVINGNEIVTAAHVIWESKTITATDVAGNIVAASVVEMDDAADIAILRIERPVGQPVAISRRPLVRGDPTSVVTRPHGSDGPDIVASTVQAAHWTSNGMSVPLIFPGMKGEKGQSGGGLFDGYDELAGIVIRIDGELGYLFAVSIRELCTRFKRCGMPTR